MNSTRAANRTLSAAAIFAATELTMKKHDPYDSHKLVPSDVDLANWLSHVENIALVAVKDDDAEIDDSKFD